MDDNDAVKSKSNPALLLFLGVAAVIFLLFAAGIVMTVRSMDHDRFVIVVTNETANDLRDVKIRGLGPAGEMGLLGSQETKTLIVNQSGFQNNSTLTWVPPSGRPTSVGRIWDAGSEAKGKMFRLYIGQGGGVADWGGRDLTFWERLYYRR